MNTMQGGTTSGSRAHIGQAHILIIEDNAANLLLMARLLAFAGVGRCEWKTAGAQVIGFAEVLPRLDLVLTDIHLPYHDGYSILRQFRAHPRFKSVPVCAVTADNTPEQMRRAHQAGFDGYLEKPVNPDEFPGQIERLLAGQTVWPWALA